VFSPYYARARRRGTADPLDHCAFNLALYGSGGRRWTLTERGRCAVERSADRLAIGPSRLEWRAPLLMAELHERSAPWLQRVHGGFQLQTAGLRHTSYPLDAAGHHCWTPYATRARIAVEFDRPRLRWQGTAYFDGNRGDRALERDFSGWTWSRCSSAQRTLVDYHVTSRDRSTRTLALDFDAQGNAAPRSPSLRASLPRTGWGIARETSTWDREPPRLLRTLEDGPFYARSLLTVGAGYAAEVAVHESLSLERFDRRWVQWLLPFRMPRRSGAVADIDR
jgi:carotenoid 1,2-hydratase